MQQGARLKSGRIYHGDTEDTEGKNTEPEERRSRRGSPGAGEVKKNSEKANTLWKGSVGKSSGKTDKRLNSKTFVYFFRIFFHCRPKARDDCAFADLSPCPLCLCGSFCRIFRIRQYDILSNLSRINESYHFYVVHPMQPDATRLVDLRKIQCYSNSFLMVISLIS